MWIDTHTHFDAPVFEQSRASDWTTAQSLGVSAQFIMGITPSNFSTLVRLADDFDGTYFALGIHPLFIQSLNHETALLALQNAVKTYRHHPRFIGIGEIGLDGFVNHVDWQRQIDFFTAQLKIARDFDLPVFMHVRKAQDTVLKYCRHLGIRQGIAHAFNGSHQQATHYLKQGFKLGFGGAMTFDRAKQLRRLVTDLALESFVLETDAPDMSPAWAYQQSNYSHYLPRIAEQFATLRGIEPTSLAMQIQQNTLSVITQTPAYYSLKESIIN